MKSIIKISRVVLALIPLILVAAAPSNVRLEVAADGGNVDGMTAGNQVAWVGLVHTREGYLDRVKVVRGIGTVGTSGKLAMPATIEPGSRSTWLLSEVASPNAGIRLVSNAEADPQQIAVRLKGSTIEVEAAAIDLTYIDPHGHGFYFFGSDGSTIDDDHAQNGVIVVRVSTLLKFPTVLAPHAPPAAVEENASVKVFDLYEWRDTQLVVPAQVGQ